MSDTDSLASDLLPPMSGANWSASTSFTTLSQVSQPDCDGVGDLEHIIGGNKFTQSPMWSLSWEDDLIMTGVRSFDIKAYDIALGGYADLGWGDDVRSQASWATSGNFTSGVNAFVNAVSGTAPFLAGSPDFSYLWSNVKNASASTYAVYPPQLMINNIAWDYLNYTFAHEGRIPPLIEDNRLDAQYPNPTYVAYSGPWALATTVRAAVRQHQRRRL